MATSTVTKLHYFLAFYCEVWNREVSVLQLKPLSFVLKTVHL